MHLVGTDKSIDYAVIVISVVSSVQGAHPIVH